MFPPKKKPAQMAASAALDALGGAAKHFRVQRLQKHLGPKAPPPPGPIEDAKEPGEEPSEDEISRLRMARSQMK